MAKKLTRREIALKASRAAARKMRLFGPSEAHRLAHTTHGGCAGGHSREYKSWSNMIQRCTNPRNTKYSSYGGRGIQICRSWLNSFAVFFQDMGTCPIGCSLDRIDVDGDYEPSNCQWSPAKRQARNKQVHTKRGTGVYKLRKKFEARIYGKSLGLFPTFEEAVAARQNAIAMENTNAS